MGPFPRVLMGACLNVLKYLFFVAGGLMAVLLVVQQVRGDAEAAPLQLAIGAAVMLGLGFVSAHASTFFMRPR